MKASRSFSFGGAKKATAPEPVEKKPRAKRSLSFGGAKKAAESKPVKAPKAPKPVVAKKAAPAPTKKEPASTEKKSLFASFGSIGSLDDAKKVFDDVKKSAKAAMPERKESLVKAAPLSQPVLSEADILKSMEEEERAAKAKAKADRMKKALQAEKAQRARLSAYGRKKAPTRPGRKEAGTCRGCRSGREEGSDSGTRRNDAGTRRGCRFAGERRMR